MPEALRRAYAHWDAGQARQAEILCRQILAASPGQADASHLLGLIAHAYGRRELALELVRQACRAQDVPGLYFSNLAEMCRLQGMLAEAEAAARRAVDIAPDLAGAWNNLGIIQQESGLYAESAASLERVAAIQPDSPEAHNNLGNTYARVGRLQDARRAYGKALALREDYAEAHSNLAFVLGELGLYDEAASAAQRAIECNPRLADAYINLAGIENARSGPARALPWIEALLAFAPTHAAALAARARLQAQRGAAPATQNEAGGPKPAGPGARPAAGEDAGADAGDAAQLARQAMALLNQRQYAQAESLLRAGIDPRGSASALWRLLGLALKFQDRVEEALQIQEMLVRAMPGDMSARFDLAETLLLQGDFARGWREYRWRYSLSHTVEMERKVQRPRWDGSHIPGRTLLIHDEQGYGDTLQFIWLVEAAKARSGAHVVLQVHGDLLPLARRVTGADAVIARGRIPPSFDVHCELMSLPMALGLRLDDLPVRAGYLSADAGRMDKWRQRLAALPRPWVALVWAGRPTHTNDANRSMSLADLAPLARPGVSYLALQKGPAAAQAASPPAGMRIVPLDAEIQDFEDTAAILALADLLISVDSAPVHLAGGLGRPAWVMLPFAPDWRWLRQRTDTPWYPSLRLFRQPAPGDWNAVVKDIAQALAREIAP